MDPRQLATYEQGPALVEKRWRAPYDIQATFQERHSGHRACGLLSVDIVMQQLASKADRLHRRWFPSRRQRRRSSQALHDMQSEPPGAATSDRTVPTLPGGRWFVPL